MSQPTAYSKATNFAQEEANNVGGRSTVRASRVDAELSNIETTLRQTLANLALIQRDDGKVRDGAVELFSLSAAARAALQGQLTPRGDWSSPTSYAVNDVVQVNGIAYLCVVAHTSGTFATDLAAGKWLLTAAGSASVTTAAAMADLASSAAGKGTDLLGFPDAIAPAYLKTVSDILNKEPVQVLRFINRADHAAIRARTGTTDHAANINAAIQAIYDAGGGELTFPFGRYRNGSSINWLPTVNLVGEGSKFNSASLIQGLVTLATPVILADAQVGTVVQTGIDGTSQRQLRAQMRGIAVTHAGTTLDCDAVRLRNSWFAELRDCSLYARVGFGVRSYDCNGLQMREVASSPSYLESLADSIIAGCDFAPADYPAVDGGLITSILWMSGCSKNIVLSSMIYNAPPGVAKTFTATNGVQNLTCTAHGLTTGTPVILETTNTLPTGLVSGAVAAYVSVVDANTLKLASSRANLTAGTFLTPTSSGTGAHTFRIGGKANLYLNDTSTRNTFTANRFDQSYWSGVALRASHRNTFEGNTIHENGRANATGQSGVELVSSDYNALAGNVIDGEVTATATGVVNQTVGIDVVSGTGNKIGANTVTSHTTANLRDAGTRTMVVDRRTVDLPAMAFEVSAGTPALTNMTGARKKAFAFDAASDELVHIWWSPPAGYTKWMVNFRWANMGAGAGDVAWLVQYAEYLPGDAANGNEASTVATIIQTAGLQDVEVQASGSAYFITTNGDGRQVSIRVKRSAVDVADTLANDAGFIAMQLTAYE